MPNKIIHTLRAPIRWLKKLYDWTISWSGSPKATYALFGVAFIESSFFPVPPDVLLITMTMARKKKWFWYATVATIGSACGALLGYFIGWAFYETAGKLIVEFYKLQGAMQIVGQKYAQNAFLTIFTAAFTPIPYKVITIAAGVFQVSLVTLIIASIIGRAGRFFLVAGAIRIFGEKIADKIEKYFDIISLAAVALLVSGFLAIKFLWKN